MNRAARLLTQAAVLGLVLPGTALAAPRVSVNLPAAPGATLKGPAPVIHWTTSGWSGLDRILTFSGFPSGPITIRNPPATGVTPLPALRDGTYTITADVSELGPIGVRNGFAVSIPIRVDSTAPGAPFVTVNPGAANRATNRASVSVNVVGSDARSFEIRTSQRAFGPCNGLFLEEDGTGCVLAPASGIYNGTVTLPPGPDGPRAVYVRARDAAVLPCPPGVIACAWDPLNSGNVSTFVEWSTATVLLDTTPPAPALRRSSPAGVAGTTIALDATPSVDPGGTAASGIVPDAYRWDFGDGSAVRTGAPATVSHRYPGPGSYRAEVRATDAAGNTGSLRFTVLVDVAGGGTIEPVPGDPGGGGTPPPPQPVAPPTGTPAQPAPPAEPGGVTATPRLLGLSFSPRGGFRVSSPAAGVVRIVLSAPGGRRLGVIVKRVPAGGAALRTPRGLAIRARTVPRVIAEARLVVAGRAGPARRITVAGPAITASSRR